MGISKARKAVVSRALLSGMLALSLTGCGGGGGGGGGSASPSPSPSPTPTPTPAPLPAANVVFSGSRVQGTTALYRVDDNVTSETLLSTGFRAGARLIDFAISPDGKWVAYNGSPDGATPLSLYVVPIGGGTPVEVSRNSTTSRYVSSFEWSPDSRRLVYDGNFGQSIPYEKTREVYVVDRNGDNHAKLSGSVGNPPKVEVRNPDWSPNGTKVLTEVAKLTNGQGGATAYRYNVYDLVAKTGYALVDTTDGIVGNARWAPDNRKVCYTIRKAGATAFQLHYATADSEAPKTFLVSPQSTFNSSCRWSEDATRLAFFEQADVGAPGVLRIRNLATGGGVAVADLTGSGQQVKSYEFRPGDDTYIAFVANLENFNSYQLYLGRTDRTENVRLGLNLPAGRDVLDFRWSPDGMTVAYRADADGNGTIDLVLADAITGANRRVVVPGLNVIDYRWSPEADRLVFSAGTDDAGSEVYTLRPSSLSFVRNSSADIITVRKLGITYP